jgi:hypothetical protein
MKIIVVFTLVIVGGILATGCVGQIKNTTTNGTMGNTTISFAPFSNATNISNISNVTQKPGLNGSLRVSIGGVNEILPAYVDNKSIGNVTTVKPLDLMLEEGNHTVKVCCGIICEQEIVTIKFAKKQTVDFSERIQKDCEFFEPTIRILTYSTSGDLVQINMEFINPTTKAHSMSAEVTVGYSYIDPRSKSKVGNFVKGRLSSTLQPGDRITKTLNLDLIEGSGYTFDIPIISDVSIN